MYNVVLNKKIKQNKGRNYIRLKANLRYPPPTYICVCSVNQMVCSLADINSSKYIFATELNLSAISALGSRKRKSILACLIGREKRFNLNGLRFIRSIIYWQILVVLTWFVAYAVFRLETSAGILFIPGRGKRAFALNEKFNWQFLFQSVM